MLGMDDDLTELMQKEREYDKALTNWKNYKTWEKNRNPERAVFIRPQS
jgi:hypothetical protein